MEGDNSENAGSYFVYYRNNDNTFFRPNVSFSVEGAALITERPIVLMEILPQIFLTRIKFPVQSPILEIDRFERVGTNKLKIEGSCVRIAHEYVSTVPRAHRVYPAANFTLIFKFPAQIGEVVIVPVFHINNGYVHVEVPRAGGEVELTRYQHIQVSDQW